MEIFFDLFMDILINIVTWDMFIYNFMLIFVISLFSLVWRLIYK